MRKFCTLMAGLVLAIFVCSAGCAQVFSNLCQITGTLFNQDGTLAVDEKVKFSTLNIGAQNINTSPACLSGGIVVPQTRTVYTDTNGQLPIPLNFPQCAMVDVSIGGGQPQRIQIPTNSSADLDTLLLAVTDPPALVSQISCVGCSVINPPLGTVGTATITVSAGSGFPLTGNVSANGFLIQQLGTPGTNGDALSWGNPAFLSQLTIPGGGTIILNGGGEIQFNQGGFFTMSGSSSGTITFLTHSTAGTYDWIWPTVPGNFGGLFYSGGGGNPNAWLNDVAIGSVLASDGTTTQPRWVTTLPLGANGGSTGAVVLYGTSSGHVVLQAASGAGNATVTLPLTNGSAGAVLTSDAGAGTGYTWGNIVYPPSTIGSLPACSSTVAGAVATVTNSDSACSFNSAPTHSSCTVGTNCYTCQVQCAEAGSTSYAWIAY